MIILIPTFAFGREGGFRVLSRLADELIDAGHTVDFLAPANSGPPYFPTQAGVVRVDRAGTFRRESAQRPGDINGIDGLISLYRGISAIGSRYDVILTNQCFTPWVAWLAAPPGVRIVYYIQAYEPDFYDWMRRPIHWMLAKLSYRLPVRRVVNAPLYLDYKGIRADDWVPPGLDLQLFHPKSELKDLQAASTIVLGCIGRHEPYKGTGYALEAFERLWAKDRRYKLRVALGNLPAGWSHPAVEVVPIESDRELAAFYRSLDIMIAAGTAQLGAAHYPVMEAMACGIPVVTTGYLPANPENSWIVEKRNVAAICAAVANIVDDRQYRDRIAQAALDIAPFAWEATGQKMLEILRDAR